MLEKRLKIVEIFRSIQGEGANVGKQATFIRLSHCNLNCWFCDTDWSKGTMMTVKQVLDKVNELGCKFIIWTGGEPTIQLTEQLVMFFKHHGYIQAIETNGTNKPPHGLDYITCSPKVDIKLLSKNFKGIEIGEFRYPYGVNEPLPPSIDDLPKAQNYYISPIFTGKIKQRFEINDKNIQACLNFIKSDERWRFSLQTHKIINVQ